MTKQQSIRLFYRQGVADALDLRARAPEMDGTELIDEEEKIPAFVPNKDYSGWKSGQPVRDEEQVWVLIQPHNASHYVGRPSTMRSLWGLAHTKNPEKAKAWVEPYGTSGMYMQDECYKEEDGRVYRCKTNNVVYRATAMPEWWEEVEV